MKIARIPFNRPALWSGLQFTPETMKEIMGYLPPNSFVVGFGSDASLLIDYIFVQNDIFKDTPAGSIPPDIDVSLGSRPDGTAYCNGVSWMLATPTTNTIAYSGNTVRPHSTPVYPPAGSVPVPTLGLCDKAPWPVILHEYAIYTGLNVTEETCKYCGVKKP